MIQFERKTYPENATVFREGDIAYCAYLLKSGRVEISTIRDGRRVSLTTVHPNQLFGELALIDGEPRSASATTLDPCEVIVVKPEDFERHLNGLDEFMKYWVDYLTERVRDLSKRVQD